MVMRTFVQSSGTCKWLSAEVAQARPTGSGWWSVVVSGTSLAVQWLRLCLPMQAGLIQSLVRELKSHSPWDQNIKKKQKQYCDKFNKDFKSGPHQKILKIVGLDKLSRFY